VINPQTDKTRRRPWLHLRGFGRAARRSAWQRHRRCVDLYLAFVKLVGVRCLLAMAFEEGSDPGGSRYLPQLAAAALQQYQAAGS